MAALAIKASRVSRLAKFLRKFPDDTDMWKDATDELVDIARWIRHLYNERVENEAEYIPAINLRSFDNPGKRNKAYKTQIRELWSGLSTEKKDEVLAEIEQMRLR